MTTYSLDPQVVRSMLTSAAPGPWSICYHDDQGNFRYYIQAAAGDMVADLPDEWMCDNASLIAAAPTLAQDFLNVCTELRRAEKERNGYLERVCQLGDKLGEVRDLLATYGEADMDDPGDDMYRDLERIVWAAAEEPHDYRTRRRSRPGDPWSESVPRDHS